MTAWPLAGEPRPTDPVDPDALMTAFVVIAELTPPRGAQVTYSEEHAAALWEQIRLELGLGPQATSDLFRRAMALSHFFADAGRRGRFGIGSGPPEPEIWRTAAAAPDVQEHIDGLAWDSFDEAEFAMALREKRA